MAGKRTDSKGRILRDGENQMKDGRYRFQFFDVTGKRVCVYSWKLVETDRLPKGKRDDISLREKEEKLKADRHDGIRNTRATLNDVFDLYISGKKNELKQSTRTNYVYMYDKFVRDSIGQKKIDSLKYSDIRRFYNSLIENGFRPNSLETINTILHPTFTLAVRDGLVRCNPSDGVMCDIKKSNSWEKPKRHSLTIEEQTAFINFVSKSEMYNHWLTLFTVFLGTGCRVGEVIGLRWEDCDFENNSISINHNAVYRVQDNGKCEFHITTPKTLAGCRTIPMMKDVKSALLIERKRQMEKGFCTAEIDGYSGFVFANREGYIHNPQTINRAISRICTAYNEQEKKDAETEKRQPLFIRHFSVHNLRHTFCTRFCEVESDIKAIQEIMGHSDINTTVGIYDECTKERKENSISRLEGKIKIS